MTLEDPLAQMSAHLSAVTPFGQSSHSAPYS